MDELSKLVHSCATGDKLLTALRAADATNDLADLIVAVINELGGHPAPALPAASELCRAEFKDALCVFDSLMFLNPRGKQQLALFPDKCVIRTAKADISVPWSAIRHVAIIDSIPKDTKGKVLLVLNLASEAKVLNGKAVLTAIVVQTTAQAQLDVAHPQGGGRLQGAAAVVMCQALGAVPGGVDPTCFVSPDAQYFQSADRAAGVSAFVKARQGFLYPLPAAFCFLEAPALYLPHAAIRSVELMRAGGSSATFDLVLHLRAGGVQEFGMVPREELAGITEYIRKCRLAVGSAESSDEERGPAAAAAAAESDDSDDDSQDEDFNPQSSSSDEDEEAQQQQQQQQRAGSSGSGKRKRAASGEDSGAAPAKNSGGEEEQGGGDNDDEEEDDDDDEGEGSSEEEDSSDDDGSVELVSEDDFSTAALTSMIAEESSGSGRGKRQRL
ncbi:hypothetical protein D9Q98_004508 [Chlorella vulgaris]|uniref:FACT complex subunit SSRP1 n=1 Tax=Chlorella vulgaris TaxID=3077 RepID=A0A9D4TQ73_CHLVU|nr:hypothetical protein D9Q98_004508 [Chlorella vulgaris]